MLILGLLNLDNAISGYPVQRLLQTIRRKSWRKSCPIKDIAKLPASPEKQPIPRG